MEGMGGSSEGASNMRCSSITSPFPPPLCPTTTTPHTPALVFSAHPPTPTPTPSPTPTIEARKLRRVESNRVSAQRSRMRKLQHVAYLERQSSLLETKIGVLGPQIAAYKKEKELLLKEKRELTQKLGALQQEKILKDEEIARNQAEVRMLREVERQQREQKEANQAMAYFDWDNNNNNLHFPFPQMVYADPLFGQPQCLLPVPGGLGKEEGISSSGTGREVNHEAMSETEALLNNPSNSMLHQAQDQPSNPHFPYAF